MSDNKCLFCAGIIPEGRQICPVCEMKMLALGNGQPPRINPRIDTVKVKTAITARITITNKIPMDEFIEKYHANIEAVKRAMEEHYKKHVHLLFRGKLTKFDKVEAETYEITAGLKHD